MMQYLRYGNFSILIQLSLIKPRPTAKIKKNKKNGNYVVVQRKAYFTLRLFRLYLRSRYGFIALAGAFKICLVCANFSLSLSLQPRRMRVFGAIIMLSMDIKAMMIMTRKKNHIVSSSSSSTSSSPRHYLICSVLCELHRRIHCFSLCCYFFFFFSGRDFNRAWSSSENIS